MQLCLPKALGLTLSPAVLRRSIAGGGRLLGSVGLPFKKLSPETMAGSHRLNKQMFFIAQCVGRGKGARGLAEGEKSEERV